jgi:small subunit ribosomal protein S13e
MARMHSKGHGIARRCLPYRKTPPSWMNIGAKDLIEQIIKMAKRGSSPSQIGVVLRDNYGIPQVKGVTGNKIMRILKKNGLAPTLPEDLYHMIKKAVNIRKHLEKNRKDKDTKFRLILVESRIHRLARYYRTSKALPSKWRYNSKKADTLIA